jgi:hypothetical protein
MKKDEVIQAFAESVEQAENGEVHDARKAVQKLLDELEER